MIWAPANIAWFCLDAGFPAAVAPLAVARALAATGGDSTFQFPSPPTPYASHTGLWAVDTLGWDPLDRVAIMQPRTAARDAVRQWKRDNKGWRWCPVRLELVTRPLLDEAIAAVAKPSPVRELVETVEPYPRRSANDVIHHTFREMQQSLGGLRNPRP